MASTDSAGNPVTVVGVEPWLPMNGRLVVLNGNPRVIARGLQGKTARVVDGPTYFNDGDPAGSYAVFLVAVPPDAGPSRELFTATEADLYLPADGADPNAVPAARPPAARGAGLGDKDLNRLVGAGLMSANQVRTYEGLPPPNDA